jgi:hypothetical protein
MQPAGRVAAQLLPLEWAARQGGKGRPTTLSGASGFDYAETAEEITRHLRSMTRHSGTDSIRRSMFVCAKTMRARAPHPQHVRHPDIRVLISSASDTIPLEKRLVPNVI